MQALLFDEPLANLDPAAGRATIELIDRIQERTGAAVIIIEHRLEDVLWRRVDRIVLMDEGKIVADMPTKAFLSGSMLLEHGIREPLYLTALRYAGIPITEELEPQRCGQSADFRGTERKSTKLVSGERRLCGKRKGEPRSSQCGECKLRLHP